MKIPTKFFLTLAILLLPISFTQAAGGYLSVGPVTPSSTIYDGTPVYFNVGAVGFDNHKTFSVSDSFDGGTVSASNINRDSGTFYWTPTSNDVGEHELKISAYDESGHYAYTSQKLTVNGVSAPYLKNINPSTIISVGDKLTMSVAAPLYTAPIKYRANDSTPSGNSTVFEDNINSLGNFIWNPIETDIGPHMISIYVSDSAGHKDILSQRITVNNNPTPQAPAEKSAYKFFSTIKLKETSTDVSELQKRLTAEGVYSGPITGYFGNATLAAVKKYQKLHNLEPVGIVGPGTRNALNRGI